MIPIVATTSGDGVLQAGGTNIAASYFASAVNIGAGATLNVAPFLPSVSGVTSDVCETNAAGTCTSAQAGQVNASFPAGTVKFFKVAATSSVSGVAITPWQDNSREAARRSGSAYGR